MRLSLIAFIATVSTAYAVNEESTNLRRREYVLPEEPPEVQPSRYFVQYRPGRRSTFRSDFIKRSGSSKVLLEFEEMDTMVVSVSKSELESLKNNPDVQSWHADVPRYPQYIPESIKHRDLQGSGEQIPYGIDMVQAREVWALGARGAKVKVCVIDTGVDSTHEDLDNVSGVESDSLPWGKDGVGHGTHCAGTIAASENGKGVVGVAPDAEIFSVKVFSDSGGFAYSSGILGAARECAVNGANIISMSLGGPLPNPFELFGFRQLIQDNGIISVAAAGNSGSGMWSFPASYPGVISVGAVDENKELAEFSQYNRQVDIAAPGVDVLSTFPMKAPCMICDEIDEYQYGTISGTSMATPHVAGVLALLKSFKPDASSEELIDAMFNTAEDLGESGKDKRFGNGLVQALSAAEYLNGGSLSSTFSNQPIKSSDCRDGLVHFDLKMLTDDFANETYWELRRLTDGGVELSGAGYEDNSAVTLEKCIRKNCYTFTMFDSSGDGMCCGYGNGAYSLSVDGEKLISNAGEFGSEEMTTFGACVEDASSKSKRSKP